MATACLFIGWNRPVPSQHKEAYGYLIDEGRALLDKWQKEGWFEVSRACGLTAHEAGMKAEKRSAVFED